MKAHRQSAVAPRPDGNVVVRWEPPDIVEIVFSGYVTVRGTEYAIDGVCQHPDARFLLINATDVTGFEPGVRVPGVTLLRVMKERGIKHAVAVAPSPGVRMIGSAVAFVAALKVDFFALRRDAIGCLEQKRSEAG